MILRFKKVTSWFQVYATALLAVSSTHINNWLQLHDFNNTTILIVTFIIAVLFIRLLRSGIGLGISSSRWIRKQILRRYFVEGYWFDIVTVPDEKRLREFGIIEIDYEDGSLVLSGVLFDLKFRRIGSFSSNVSKYSGHKMEYGYSRIAEHDKLENASGIGNYVFDRERPWPLSFSASFFDSELDKRVLVRGIKITNSESIAKLTSSESEDKAGVVREQAQLFLEKFPEYKMYGGITALENADDSDRRSCRIG